MSVVAAALGLLGAFLAIRSCLVLQATPRVGHAVRGVDPNTAEWADLALLPDIGEQTARAIIEYRSVVARCAFRRPQDLLPVKGIGPKTVEAIAPHLRFDACDER